MAEPLIPITRKSAFIFAAFLVLYEFLTYIANDMIMPGMIHVVETFNAEESAVATSLTAYILGGAALQLILGPLSDRYGRRPVMLTGAALFMVTILIGAFTQNIEQFLFLRFLQGMGLCFIGVIGYTTIQEIFAEVDAIRLIAIMANTANIAPLLGPLAGAGFLLYFDWRMIFVLIGILSLIALVGLHYFMPETVGVQKNDGTINKPIVFSFKNIVKNYRKLLTNPAFMFGSLGFGFIEIPIVAWIAISPVMLIAEAKMSMVEYALCQIPIFSSLIIGNLILRRLTHAWKITHITLLGSIIAIFGLILAPLLVFFTNHPILGIVISFSIYSLGLGVCTAPLNRQILFSTPITKGIASAMMSMAFMLVLVCGIEAIQYGYELKNNSNLWFTIYCLISGFIYVLGISIFYGDKIRLCASTCRGLSTASK